MTPEVATALTNMGNTIVSAGIGASSSLLNYGLQRRLLAEQRKENFNYNEKAAENADKRQRAQYNDLYSPKALLGQYAAAGLSPSMMLSGGAPVVGQSSAQGNMSASLSGPYPSFQPIDPLSFAQIANINANTKKTEAETDNISKDTELKGQEIINIIADTNNKKITNRILSAEADLAELEFSTNLQTAQATIRMAYSNAEKAAQEARSLAVKADLDEATFDCAYQMAYANLNNTLTDTALMKSEIGVNKAQIKEIAERIRNSQWQTWAIEKTQNREDAFFAWDKAKFAAEVEMWAKEQNIELTKAQMEMVSYLVGYVCNVATAGMANATKIKTTDMYTKTQKDIATTPKTTHTQNYTINKKGRKVIRGGSYKQQN